MQNNSSLPATKADLEKFVTKDDLKSIVAKLATKEDLKIAVAKLDTKITQTEKSLRAEIRITAKNLEQTEKSLRAVIRITAEEIKEEIREDIKRSESRIIDVLDSFLGEMKTSEEERTISAHRLRDHDDRITVLEQKAGIAVV